MENNKKQQQGSRDISKKKNKKKQGSRDGDIEEKVEFIPSLPRFEALFMGKTPVKLLFTASTHNFISPSVLEDRSLIIKEDDPLLVQSMLGGSWTTTEGRIDGAQVNLQGFKFAADFYLFPNLAGCDMLLGSAWQVLSFTQQSLNSSEYSFMFNGKNYHFSAEKHPPGTITQSCCMSVWGIRKSMLRSE